MQFMFLTKTCKILPSLNDKTGQGTTKTAPAVCLMLITFLLVSFAAIIGVVTQRFFPEALRDDPNNGCEGLISARSCVSYQALLPAVWL